MAINKKLIYYNRTLSLFLSDANGLNGQTTKDANNNVGNIPFASIVFTSDGYIWTHGKTFNGNNTSAVTSVNGKTGAVTLNLDDIADGSSRKLSNYLPLSGGTMSGTIHIPYGYSIGIGNTNTGHEMLAWLGDKTIVGSLQGKTYIRSNNNDLIHNKAGNEYTIYTTGNLSPLTTSNYTSYVYAKSSVYTKTESDARYVNLTETQTISGNKTFSSSVSIDDLTVGNLVVNGGASFALTINGNIATADKVNHSLTILLNSGTTEGTNKFTFNGSANKSINITPSAIGAKATQSAVSDPSASGTGISYIATISLNAQGVITATKSTVRSASTSLSGIVTTGELSFAGAKTFANNLTVGSTSTNANLEVHGTTTLGNAAFGAQLEIWRKEPYYSAIKFANGSNKTALGYIGFTYDGDSTIGSILPVWVESDITKKHKITYVDTNSTTAVGGTTTPVYVDTNGQIKAGTALGTASTHAHTDYVTSISYDSTNRKLQQSKGGGTATDIVTFGSNAFNSTAYLPLSGGTMSLGEGLKFESDDNYFGTNSDARIITIIDGNSSNSTVNGGLIFRAQGYNNGSLSGTQELLRIRNLNGSTIGTGEFQWKGNEIWHSGNLTTSAATDGGTTKSLVTTGDKYKWNLVYDWLTTTTADTDATINKWKELEAFLSSVTESDTLSGLLALYLPLTNTATATVQFTVDDPSKMLNIKRGADGHSMIIYSNTSGNLGMLGFTSSSVPTYRTPSGTNYTLIHSGNISNLSVKSATYLTLNFSRGGNYPENSGEWATVKNGPTNTISNKVQFWTIYNDGGPTNYGDMLEILSRNANHWQPQLWFGSGKTGTDRSAHLYYRNKTYNSAEWGSWLTILDSDNYSSYAVAKSGDTMTGALTVPSLTVNGASSFGLAINGSILGNAATASRLLNARNIAISGAVTGNANFDGSDNITISTSVNHTHSYAGSSSAGGAATNVVVNNSDADSTYRMVWHSGNTLYSTADIYCNPNTDVLYAKSLSAKAGYLFATNNGNTVSIGSLNASFCHIQNSADIPFYFNKSVNVSGQLIIYGTSYKINSTTSVLNDLRVSGDDLYIGSASGSQCHLQYTSGTLKFIFD